MKKGVALWVMLTAFVGLSAQEPRLIILHTNDTHSQIESTRSGNGGVLNRERMIDSIRAERVPVLLVDAGDFVQGTPFFNLYGGVVEIESMNLLKYDVAGIGNHEFDNGVESLKQIIEKADFPFVNSNYDFKRTPLKKSFKRYAIFEKGGLKIGVIALAPQPKGLIPQSRIGKVKFLDPIKEANRWAEYLKDEKDCDLVVCLSHLGFDESFIPNDQQLARESEDIDVIIGGHSHTQLQKPLVLKNREGDPVYIGQTGSRGESLGYVRIW